MFNPWNNWINQVNGTSFVGGPTFGFRNGIVGDPFFNHGFGFNVPFNGWPYGCDVTGGCGCGVPVGFGYPGTHGTTHGIPGGWFNNPYAGTTNTIWNGFGGYPGYGFNTFGGINPSGTYGFGGYPGYGFNTMGGWNNPCFGWNTFGGINPTNTFGWNGGWGNSGYFTNSSNGFGYTGVNPVGYGTDWRTGISNFSTNGSLVGTGR